MLFNLNPGHTLSGGDVGTRGINGLKEEVLTRQLIGEIDKELRGRGHKTNICRVDYASTLQESLNKQVALCNSVNADLNICIHFNTTIGGYGSEVYTYNGRYLIEADRVLKELNKLGFRNRGIKNQGLALTRRTKAKTIYIEVCFIDSSEDVAILNKYGMNGIAKAIVNGVLGTSSNIPSCGNSSSGGANSNSSSSSSTIYGRHYLIKELQQEINRQGFGNVAIDCIAGDATLNASPVCRQGARGNITKTIQQMLINIGYPVGNYGADGVYGNGTVAAVKALQRDCNLSVDGIVGKETWKVLFRNLK